MAGWRSWSPTRTSRCSASPTRVRRLPNPRPTRASSSSSSRPTPGVVHSRPGPCGPRFRVSLTRNGTHGSGVAPYPKEDSVAEELVTSWAEVDAYRQCPFKWRLAYAERWVAPEPSAALSKGILWHKVLEIHYDILANGGKLGEAIERVQRYLMYVESEWVELIAWMYNGYIQYWQGADNKLQFIKAEPKLELPLMPGIRIKCRLDLLCRDWDGLLWMWDHKSCAN